MAMTIAMLMAILLKVLKQGKNMKIEMWSDYACPFCYIGFYNLQAAISHLPQAIQDKLEVTLRSYELNAHAPQESQGDYVQLLADKYGKTLSEAQDMIAGMKEHANQAGLTVNSEQIQATNTYLAHVAYQVAITQGLGNELAKALFLARFVDGKNLANTNVLLTLCQEVGVVADQQVWQNPQYNEQVAEDLHVAAQLGIQGVPFFVLNQSQAFSGALPVAAMEQVLMDCHQQSNA